MSFASSSQGELVALVEQPPASAVVVDHERGHVVEAAATTREHLPVDRRQLVVLHHELDLHGTRVAERVADVGLDRLAAVEEAVGAVVRGDEEGACTRRGGPVLGRTREVVHHVGELEDGKTAGRHSGQPLPAANHRSYQSW